MQSPDPDIAPRVRHVVVMGVSGTGKSTIGRRIAEELGWTCADADDFHPARNLELMTSGVPLTEAERRPWLAELAAWTREQHDAGHRTVLSCSALRRAHRDALRQGVPATWFVHLTGPAELIAARMRGRDHFMPVPLLDSQLATLEPLADDEDGLTVHIGPPPEQVVATVIAALTRDDRLSPPAPG